MMSSLTPHPDVPMPAFLPADAAAVPTHPCAFCGEPAATIVSLRVTCSPSQPVAEVCACGEHIRTAVHRLTGGRAERGYLIHMEAVRNAPPEPRHPAAG